MKEHPQARSHITLNEFQYVHGLKARLRGLALERGYYENLIDDEIHLDMIEDYRRCINQISEQITDLLGELYRYKRAQHNSDSYHHRRRLRG